MSSRLDVIRAVLQHAVVTAAATKAAATAIASVAAALDTDAGISEVDIVSADARVGSGGGGGGRLGTVAAAVMTAAVSRVRAAVVERGFAAAAGDDGPVHRQLTKLLELACLLGLTSPHDVLQVG